MNTRIISSFVLFVLIISCQEKKSEQVNTQSLPSIIIKEILVSSDNCDPESSNCTYVHLEYPEYSDSTKGQLNQIITDKMKVIAADYFREDAIEGTFEYIAELFIRDFEDFKVDFPAYQFGWYVKIFAEIIYESEKLISLRIDSESFTGGAHPNSSTSLYVIDIQSYKELTTSDIISDTTKFKQILEQEFRKVKGMREDQSFADVGFYINDGDFLLNDNIGITETSVIVQFNPYEIAPYSEGATTLEIDQNKLSGLLKVR